MHFWLIHPLAFKKLDYLFRKVFCQERKYVSLSKKIFQ